MLETAVLEVRVLPWRPRPRVMKPDTFVDVSDVFGTPLADGDDLLVGLAVSILLVVAAPLLVLLLAALLLSVELPIVLAAAVLVLVVRFTGIVPWTVATTGADTGEESRERFRTLWRAAGRVRAINPDRRIRVRWSWT